MAPLKRMFVIAVVAMGLGVMTLPLVAQVADAELAEVELALRTAGYFVEPGSSDSAAGLSNALADADAEIYVVSFADDMGEDEGIIAERIADGFSSGTFVVLTPFGVGADSFEFSESELNDALDAAEGNWDSLASGIEAFDRSLAGKGGFPLWQTIVAAIAGFFGWNIYRRKKRDEDAQLSRLEEARQGIREQVDDVSNDILALSDRVAVADNAEATEYYRQGSEIFSAVSDAVGRVQTEMELANLSADLTESEWKLESAEAILDGRPVPEKPTDRPIECFFHAHRAGIEQADVKTAAGQKAVSVCRECGERLRKGERPEASTVSVGGRRVPRSVAPRSYGGGGFDAMDAFEIVVAGSRGARYDNWGTRRRSSNSRRSSSPSSRSSSKAQTRSRPKSRSGSRSSSSRRSSSGRSSRSRSRVSRRRR